MDTGVAQFRTSHLGILRTIRSGAVDRNGIGLGSVSAPHLHAGVDSYGHFEHRRLDVQRGGGLADDHSDHRSADGVVGAGS